MTIPAILTTVTTPQRRPRTPTEQMVLASVAGSALGAVIFGGFVIGGALNRPHQQPAVATTPSSTPAVSLLAPSTPPAMPYTTR